MIRLFFPALLVFVFSVPAFSQLVMISDGMSSFSYDLDSTLALDAGNSDFFGPTGGDNAFSEAWFIEIDGGGIFRLDSSNLTSPPVNSGALSNASFSAGGVGIDIGYEISTIAGNAALSANVLLSLDLLTAVGPVSGRLINYFDLDLNGIAVNTTAQVLPGNQIQITGPDGTTAIRQSALADEFELGEFDNLILDIAAGGHTLAGNTTFGPGDFTGAFSYDFDLDLSAPNLEFSAGSSEIGADLTAVPEPASFLSCLVGVVLGYARFGRRRRKSA